MALLEIIQYPDPRLKQKSTPVSKVDARVKTLLENMAETMYDAPGIGLAAPQIGVNERIIVVHVSEDDDDEQVGKKPGKLYKVVNPEIVHKDGEIEYEEGCLSIPGIKENVKRAAVIVVKGLDENGKPFELEADGLLAVCFQHEIDHLDGVLFIDRLSQLKRTMIRSKLAKRG